MPTSVCLADSNQASSLPATVSPSQYPESLKTSLALKTKNTSVRAIRPSANDDVVQRKIQPRSGLLILDLHEGIGISVPEHYKLLSDQDSRRGTGPESNPVTPLVGISLDVPDSHNSQGDSHSREVGTPKEFSGVYALLECDKSQVFLFASSGTVENPFWTTSRCRFDVFHMANFSVHIYMRHLLSTPGSGRTQYICLGVARPSHGFKNKHCCVQDSNETESAIAKSHQDNTDTIFYTEWLELEHGTGKIHISVEYSEKNADPLRVEDFEILQKVGGRKSRKTFQVRKRNSGRLYSLKEIRKTGIGSQAEVADTFEVTKGTILPQAKNPFIVHVKFVFQSAENLYLVLPFVHGGELMQLLFNERCFDVDRIKHYATEILCALESLHDSGIVYGNLKPGSIILDYSGHITICDFALGPLDTKDYTNEACGSPYLAPEISLGQGYTQVVDWWTLGILLAEMLTSFEPSWYDENITNIQSITQPIVFPAVVPPVAQDICIKLLKRDPEQRLGANGIADIKAHTFFENIDWSMVLKREYEPFFKPNDTYLRLDTNPQFLAR